MKNTYVDSLTHVPECTEMSHKFPSVTIPDMSYTLEELIARHRAGLLTDAEFGREPVWSEDADFDDPDMEKMMQSDIVDKHEFAEAGREAIRNNRSAAAKAEADAAAKAEDERINAIVLERLNALKAPPNGGA